MFNTKTIVNTNRSIGGLVVDQNSTSLNVIQDQGGVPRVKRTLIVEDLHSTMCPGCCRDGVSRFNKRYACTEHPEEVPSALHISGEINHVRQFHTYLVGLKNLRDNIQELEIDCVHMNAKAFSRLVNVLPNLKVLSIGSCYVKDDSNALRIIESMKHLVRLKINRPCYSLEDMQPKSNSKRHVNDENFKITAECKKVVELAVATSRRQVILLIAFINYTEGTL